MEFIQNHLFLIGCVVYVLMIILQSVTKHFSEYPKVVKVCMVILDLLSIVPSKGSPGLFKLPLTLSKKSEKEKIND